MNFSSSTRGTTHPRQKGKGRSVKRGPGESQQERHQESELNGSKLPEKLGGEQGEKKKRESQLKTT